MSKESMDALIKKMNSDKEFENKVMAAESIEERIEIVNAAGFDVVEADIQQAFDLSDKELQQAVGGNQESLEGCSCDCVCHCHHECKVWT